MPPPFLPLILDSFDGKALDSRESMDRESHRALVQMTLRASVHRSGGARFHCQVRDAWFFSPGVVRLFARYRLRNLIPRRVTVPGGARGLQNCWWFAYRVVVGSIPHKRIIYDRRKEIYRLHNCPIPADSIYTGIIGSGAPTSRFGSRTSDN